MLVRRIARPMLAAVFVAGGIDTLRNPAPRVKAATPLIEKGEQALPDDVTSSVPTDPDTLVKINAGVQVGGGLLLATGKLPRLASLALAGTIVPTTLAGHAFWEESEPEAKAAQRIHFLKNVGLLGGLLLAAVDTEGRPSVAWRTRRQAERVAAALPGGHAHSDTAENLRSTAHVIAERSTELAHKAAESDTTAKLVTGGSVLAATAAAKAQELAHTVATSDTTKKLADRGQELAHTAAQRGSDLASDLADEGSKRGRKLAKKAKKKADKLASKAESRGLVLAGQARASAEDLADEGSKRGRTLAKQARTKAEKARKHAPSDARGWATTLTGTVADKASDLTPSGSRRSRRLAKNAQKKADTLSSRAARAAHEVAAEVGSRGEHAAALAQLKAQRLLG